MATVPRFFPKTTGVHRSLMRNRDEEPHRNAKYAYLCATRSIIHIRTNEIAELAECLAFLVQHTASVNLILHSLA